MAVINAFATLTTQNLKADGSSESVDVKRTRAGDIYFIDTQSGSGRRVIASSSNIFAVKLWDELKALT